MYDDYSVYTSFSGALEADAEAAKQNIFQKIGAWFTRQIERFKNWLHKEKNPKGKNLIQKLISRLQGLFAKLRSAKTPEQAVELQDEGKDAIAEYNKKIAEAKEEATAAWNAQDEEGLKKAQDKQKAAHAQMVADWQDSVNAAGGEGDDDDEEDIDEAIESAKRIIKLASNEELKTAIENMASNIDMNCTTAEEALQYKENIENEIEKYNMNIKTLKFAAESARTYGDNKDRVNAIVAPAVESLRNSFAQIGLVTNAPSGVDEYACESMNYFLKTARKMIDSKVDSFCGNSDVTANESFLATLTI